MEGITYKVNTGLDVRAVAEVFQSSGINRPVEDLSRIRRMLNNANLLVSAWHDQTLVGLVRALSDFSYCCYISDIAVSRQYQRKGIGTGMVRVLRDQLSEEVMVLLIATEDAMNYYKHLCFEKHERAWYVPRDR